MIQIARLSRETGLPTDLLRRVIAKSKVKIYHDGSRHFISLADRDATVRLANEMLETRRRQQATRNLLIDLKYKEMYVYFMRCANFIKIGTADNVHRRRTELQVGNPLLIRVAAYILGTAELEEEIQIHFAENLVQGEWYRDEGRLAELVRTLEAEASPVGATTAFRSAWVARNYTKSRRKSRRSALLPASHCKET
ncbi:hypothetical protein FHR71_003338 [Methylobacterium sp. RAS18]|nr:hypothetical protein [Methylobacterium sp. RAS18]